jgi:hypothetical protein
MHVWSHSSAVFGAGLREEEPTTPIVRAQLSAGWHIRPGPVSRRNGVLLVRYPSRQTHP